VTRAPPFALVCSSWFADVSACAVLCRDEEKSSTHVYTGIALGMSNTA